ncbi:MAG TPA: molybdopterin-dependent oxidoreductase [Trebonia sp.]|nr:molybdopterin-dependent oxidoreductase [Trebonia sp.]
MTSRTRFPAWWGAVCGLLAAAAAMGIAQLLAGFTVPAASPVVAVGEAAIDNTPLAVKDWATSTFGTADKTVLLGGVLVVVFLYSMLVGVLAMRRLALGYAGLTVFAGLGVAAALTRHDATGSYAVPTLFGAVAGGFALSWLVTRARAAAAAGQADRAAREWRPAPAGPGTAGPGAAGSEAGETKPQAGDSARADNSAWSDDSAWADEARRADGGEDDGLGWLAASRYDADEPPAGRPEPVEPPATRPGSMRAGPPAGRPIADPTAASTARRHFLVAAGVAVAAAAIGEVGGRSLATRKNVSIAQKTLRIPKPTVPAAPLPRGVNLPVPGISSFITPDSQFYRVDTAILVPQVDPSNWTLRIHGMVAREVTITFDQLLRRPLIEDYITLACVSNPVGGPYVGNAKWLGTSLAALIRSAGPQAGADQLLCTSVDGFTSGTPLQVVLDGRDALVAVAMNGSVLPTEHGFPARLVVPGLYGYVSACKWVVDIEVTTFAKAQAYWVPRGWSQQGPIKTESRIDVPGNGTSLKAGQVPVAGVAWAQHKGIEAVEVRVDNGPWHEATLAAVPGIDTWRQWAWQWHATQGTHMIEARATDKTGYTQTSLIQDVAPNGASGYPSTQVSVS